MKDLAAATKSQPPLVGVGLPVFNGEKYLRGCLDSLLAQEYENFELTISDNASTDGTEAICREYAARDPRVRYQRADQNMGAVWNFRRVVELSRGEYFMWAAFDDTRAPQFIARCVKALELDQSAVMCCTNVRLIDEDGLEIDETSFTQGIRPAGATAWRRLRAVARATFWYEIYGLIRRSTLMQTKLPQRLWGFDVLLIVELCLRGPVLVIPEKLFSYRIFRQKRGEDGAAVLGPDAAEGRAVPVNWTGLTREIVRSIWLAPLPRAEKLSITGGFLAEFCLRNGFVRECIRREVAGSFREAWNEGERGRSIGLASIAGLAASVGFVERALRSLHYRSGIARQQTRVSVSKN